MLAPKQKASYKVTQFQEKRPMRHWGLKSLCGLSTCGGRAPCKQNAQNIHPMLSLMAGNKSCFIGDARKRARNLALFFSIFYVSSRKRHRNRSPGNEELAFGPCSRLSLLSRTEPCEWPCTLKIGNLLCQVASGATLQKDANPYSTRQCLPGHSTDMDGTNSILKL